MLTTIIVAAATFVVGFLFCAVLTSGARRHAWSAGFWQGLMLGAKSKSDLSQLAEKLDELKRSGKAGRG